MKRYFRFGLIFLTFAVTAMGAWTWRQHIRAQREHAALIASIALLPADATGAFGVNIADARGTVIGDRLKPTLAQWFPNHCDGLDTFDTVIGALVTPPEGAPKAALVLTGKFDQALVADCLKRNAATVGGAIETLGQRQHSIYRFDGFDVGYLDAQHVLLGTGEAVAAMLDRADHVAVADAARSLGDNAEIVALLEKTDRKGALWWAGTLPPQLRDFIKTEAGATSPFVNVGQTHGSIAFRSGVDIQIDLVTNKHSAAEQLVTPVAEVFKAVAREPAFRHAGLERFVGNVKLTTDGPSFAIRLQLNAKQTDGLMHAIDRMQKRAAGGAFNDAGGDHDAVAYSTAGVRR